MLHVRAKTITDDYRSDPAVRRSENRESLLVRAVSYMYLMGSELYADGGDDPTIPDLSLRRTIHTYSILSNKHI